MNKLKVLLILPANMGSTGIPTAPPPGLAYLAAMAIKKGHSVKVHDLRVSSKRAMYKKIDSFKPDYIGISFMSFGYKLVYELIKEIKKIHSSISIIIGGAHVSMSPKKVLQESGADFAIYGEGETTFSEILSGKPLKEINGLAWYDNRRIMVNPPREFNKEIDLLPFPRYDLFPLNKYVDKKIPIVSSRGCPYGCIFCNIGPTMGKIWRPRSAANTFDEIEQWYNKGYMHFHFVDDNFAQDNERVSKLCDLIIEKGLKIKWDLRNGIRVNKINKELLAKMKKAGCFFFVLSVESFDKEVLRIMKKGITQEMIFKAIGEAKNAGIPFGISILVGLPGDSFEKFLKNYELVKKYDFDEVRFYNAIPYPGTELDKMILENGRYLKSPEVILNQKTVMGNEPVYDYPNFSIKDKRKALRMAETLVMKKLIKKEFGPVLGALGYNLWRIRILRGPAKRLATPLWKFLRKLN